MRRRTNVALATAAGSLVAVAVFAVDDQRELAGWWTWSTVAISLALLLPLGAAAYAVSDTVCPYAAPGGRAGDVFDDLGPLFRLGPLRRLDLARHPWRFALLSGAAAGCAVFGLGWYAEGDPGSGLVRGVFEAVALVGCFVLFGRRLGLRRSESEGALDQHR